MTAEYLSQVGSALVKRCGTRDPFEIAKELGIEVLFCENFGPLKGMYRVPCLFFGREVSAVTDDVFKPCKYLIPVQLHIGTVGLL